MRTISYIIGAAAVIIVGATFPTPTQATVMDYHEFVQNYGDTLVQYDFDGTSPEERREDKKGTNDLIESGTGTVTYDVTGYDGTSDAFTPDYSVTTALLTSNGVNLPASGASFDAIFKPDSISGTTGYIAAAYDGSNRSYFASTGSGKLAVRAGGGSLSTASYTPGDWYYMATTMSYDTGSNTTTAHVYVANLSSENPTLTAYSGTMTGTFSIGMQQGIGALWYQSKLQWAFDGDIDEITLYSGVKDQDFFQDNLERIVVVPEPSSLLLSLLAVCGLGLVFRWRR